MLFWLIFLGSNALVGSILIFTHDRGEFRNFCISLFFLTSSLGHVPLNDKHMNENLSFVIKGSEQQLTYAGVPVFR